MGPINFNGASDERFWESAISVYGKKLELIASNIANADTPHYKARDIDFQSEMARVLAKVDVKGQPTSQIPNNTVRDIFPVLYRIPSQGSADNNTVEMDVERAAFADTAVRYEMAVQKVAGEYKEMNDLLKSLPY